MLSLTIQTTCTREPSFYKSGSNANWTANSNHHIFHCLHTLHIENVSL